ncbi:MAG: hypothetical protein Q9201_007136 [Fulgogasparrea decipioides]
MEAEDGLPSSSLRDLTSVSSLYSSPASLSSFAERYPSASHSYRPRLDATAEQSISHLKSLLDVLYKSKIPGPRLIRLQREFNDHLGHGGQGNVYGASAAFQSSASALQKEQVTLRAKQSALYWTKCVVKHLRTDQRRNDIQHAYREISRLCHPSLRRHPNIVNLLSLGMSLDALESVSLKSLSTPLLILERADCDLAQFIKSEQYELAEYEFLCDICLDVGRGLGAVHSAGMIHGDLKLENILLFSSKQPLRTEWTAKFCDFGSAVPVSASLPEVGRYFGSDTWLPPECYEKQLLGKPMPTSLIPCDIFTYGLVVWATFVGLHVSPLYNMQKVEGHGAEIVCNIGRQRFYARASKSVRASFSANNSNIHRLLAEFTEQTFNLFGGRKEHTIMERGEYARSRGFLQPASHDTARAVENKIRRILLVLRESLNDSPSRRDRQVWRYLNYKPFPLIPYVDDPQTFEPDNAWLCRGEVGQYELQKLKESSASTSPLWDFLFNTDNKTDIFLILFENGCEIHQIVHNRTAFGCYLNELAGVDEKALEVAVHFKRIAEEPTCSTKTKYFLTGRTSELSDDQEFDELVSSTFTTVLHEAVRATNYPLVEYLVRTRFNVSAPDSNGLLALNLAMDDRRTTQGSSDSNSILALLKQSVRDRSTLAKVKTPIVPLGWEDIGHSSGQSSLNSAFQREPERLSHGWRETSIEGDFNAITFIAPRTGLYESDRLTLGRIDGEGQTYKLDPIRFLKAPTDTSSKYEPATKTKFGEEWYEEDVRVVAEPLAFDPLNDERAWIRHPARGLYYGLTCLDRGSWLFVTFALLSVLARLMTWQRLELPFACSAVGLFGFATAGSKPGTALLQWFNLGFSEVNMEYMDVLWRNVSVLFIGISAVAHGGTTLVKTTLIGFVLCDTLWALGLFLFRGGLSYSVMLFNTTSSLTMVHLGGIASILAAILWSFYTFARDIEPSARSANVVFLSRSVAVLCLFFWANYLHFRFKTHAIYFDEEPDQIDVPRDDCSEKGRKPYLSQVIEALVCLGMLGYSADILSASLARQPAFAQTMLSYFGIPLVTRLWEQYRAVRVASADADSLLGFTLGVMLSTMLFIAPCLVSLGWMIKVPMDLQFSLMETIVYNLAVWNLSYQFHGGRFSYLSGAMVICQYILTALGLVFASWEISGI